MLLIRPERLIEGDGSPARGGMAVVVEGERIIRVCRAADLAPAPAGARAIEAPGATLLPGLVDAHVHLAYDGSPRPVETMLAMLTQSYPALALRAARHALQTLRAGVTAVRDLNAPGGVVLALRDAVAAGHVPGPRIVACGQGLSITGGHMDQGLWGDQVSLRDLQAPCDGPDGFRRGVREQVKRGADCIKINLCGGSSRELRTPYRQEMSEAEVEAAIDEAHRLERRVAAHTSGGPSVAMAVRKGLDSVEHGHWIDEATADLMAERGTAYVPTLLVNERNFEVGRAELGGSDASWAWLERAREDKWASLERVRRAGAPIVLGTDAGFMLPHGSSLARELALLVHGGLGALEAITAATSTPPDALDVEAGRVREGAVADLVLVPGDPSSDVRALQASERLRVWRAGREILRGPAFDASTALVGGAPEHVRAC
jgi:imidazolonepropionase-like amidohydrolase